MNASQVETITINDVNIYMTERKREIRIKEQPISINKEEKKAVFLFLLSKETIKK